MTSAIKRIDRTPVNSSFIASIGYSTSDQVLEIEFRSGAIYRYFDVPPEIHARFVAAESKGAHLSRHIRGRFRYVSMQKGK